MNIHHTNVWSSSVNLLGVKLNYAKSDHPYGTPTGDPQFKNSEYLSSNLETKCKFFADTAKATARLQSQWD